MTIRTDSAANRRPHRKHLIRAFSGILAMLLTLALLPGCDGKQDASAKENASTKENASAKENFCEKGIAAIEAKDYKTAVDCFTMGADKGDMDSLLMLSTCYHAGLGVEKDKEKAEELLEQAAKAGNVTAMAGYGILLLDKRNKKKEGYEYLKKSAEQDCVLAEFALASFYAEDGENAKAVEFFEKLANRPLTDRKSLIDYMPGVADDMNDLLKDDLKLKNPNTANFAIVMSQIMLGSAYAQGNAELKQDKKKAKEWLNKAKENGFAHADDFMRSLSLD